MLRRTFQMLRRNFQMLRRKLPNVASHPSNVASQAPDVASHPQMLRRTPQMLRRKLQMLRRPGPFGGGWPKVHEGVQLLSYAAINLAVFLFSWRLAILEIGKSGNGQVGRSLQVARPVRRRIPVTGHCVALYARILTYVYDNRCTRARIVIYLYTYVCVRAHSLVVYILLDAVYVLFTGHIDPYLSFSRP